MGKILIPAHESHVARELGEETLQALFAASEHFYYPVPVAGIDALVYKGKLLRPIRGAGFSSLSDLIDEVTNGGKGQHLQFVKSGTTGVVGRSNSLWNVGSVPAAGGTGGTSGTGAARSSSSTGALPQVDAAGGDSLHVIGGTFQGSVGTQMLLLYDRLWDMTHTMTVSPRSVDTANLPTRYQSTDAKGSFLSGEVTTVLPAATPTVTFTYVDQDGNTAEVGPALSTIASAAAVNTVPFTTPNWFYPLNAGDTGLRSITNVALSAAMASGVVSWFIGHPLMWVPIPTANVPVILDGINTAFNLQKVVAGACLAFMEIAKGSTTATSWWGDLLLASG